MAEAVANPRRRVAEEGWLAKQLTAAAKVIQWLLLSLLFSILIEWAGMVLWWPEQGLDHSRAMLEHELGYLDTDLRRSLMTSDPAQFARRLADGCLSLSLRGDAVRGVYPLGLATSHTG